MTREGAGGELEMCCRSEGKGRRGGWKRVDDSWMGGEES